MIFNVEISGLFTEELEKESAYAEVKLNEKSFKWDSVVGRLNVNESYILGKSEEQKIRASLIDSIDLEKIILEIEIDDIIKTYSISHNELIDIMSQNKNSFIASFNKLVEIYGIL